MRSAISVWHELAQSVTFARTSALFTQQYKVDGDRRLHIHIHLISRRVPGAFYRVRTLEGLLGIFILTRPDMDYSKRRWVHENWA